MNVVLPAACANLFNAAHVTPPNRPGLGVCAGHGSAREVARAREVLESPSESIRLALHSLNATRRSGLNEGRDEEIRIKQSLSQRAGKDALPLAAGGSKRAASSLVQGGCLIGVAEADCEA